VNYKKNKKGSFLLTTMSLKSLKWSGPTMLDFSST